jgi:putative transposase
MSGETFDDLCAADDGVTAMFRNYRFRAVPTTQQVIAFEQVAGVCRLVYNLALECRMTSWREHQRNTGRPISLASQCRELTHLRKDFDWIAAVPRVAQEAALLDLDTAFQNFFAGRSRYPRFRRKEDGARFRLRAVEIRSERLNARWARIYLPKLGWLKYRATRPFDEIKSVTISCVASQWFVSVVTVRTDRAAIAQKNAIGIDRGVASTLTLSTGTSLSVPASLKALERRQRVAKRLLSRKKRGSARYAKQQRRFASLSTRCASIRSDWMHRATTQIARQFRTVVIEDLRIADMTASGKHKRGLNRSILNQGWGIFESQLAYKLEERGGTLIKVPAAYTSQTCSACGTIDRESRESQASFVCRHCGFAIHADVNAAINILRGSTPSMRAEDAGYGADETRTRGGRKASGKSCGHRMRMLKGRDVDGISSP